MDGIKVRGLVVGSKVFSEADKLVSLCTIENGKITAKLKGCRKAGAKLRYAAALFLFADFVLCERSGYYLITECNAIESFPEFSSDIEKFYKAAAIIEFLDKSTGEAEDIVPSTLLALKALKKVAEGEKYALEKYFPEAFSVAGYGLKTEKCVKCGSSAKNYRVSFLDGGFVCPACGTGEPVTRGVIEWLTGDKDDLEPFEERELLGLFGKYFTYVVGKKLNSLAQLINFENLGDFS